MDHDIDYKLANESLGNSTSTMEMNQSNETSELNQKRNLRFSLKSILFLALFAAMVFGAFQYGHRLGYGEGERDGYASGVGAKVYPVVYRVSDLVVSDSGGPDTKQFALYDELVNAIQKNVAPKTWESEGGPASMAPYPQNLSLVVAQSDRGHDELAEFLESKRD